MSMVAKVCAVLHGMSCSSLSDQSKLRAAADMNDLSSSAACLLLLALSSLPLHCLLQRRLLSARRHHQHRSRRARRSSRQLQRKMRWRPYGSSLRHCKGSCSNHRDRVRQE